MKKIVISFVLGCLCTFGVTKLLHHESEPAKIAQKGTKIVCGVDGQCVQIRKVTQVMEFEGISINADPQYAAGE